MRRRDLFKIAGAVGLSGTLSSIIEGSEQVNQSCFCQFDCYSKVNPNKIYSTQEEFWNDHLDIKANELNTAFVNAGFILKVSSELLMNGKGVRVTKIYRSQVYLELYTQFWERLSGGNPSEYQKIAYLNFIQRRADA